MFNNVLENLEHKQGLDLEICYVASFSFSCHQLAYSSPCIPRTSERIKFNQTSLNNYLNDYETDTGEFLKHYL